MMHLNMTRRGLIGGLSAAGGLAATGLLGAQAATSGTKWVGSWASSQMVPNPDTTIPPEMASDVTIRQVARLSIGGSRLRVRLSNVFGTKPLKIDAAHIALCPDNLSPRIGKGQALTFGGRAQIVIPAGAEYLSDPFSLTVPAFTDLTVSLYLPEAATPQTSHPGARSASWFIKGNHAADATFEPEKVMERWFHLSAIDVEASTKSAAIVALGDSITDGYGVKPGTNARWTDTLSRRLQADKRYRHLSVLNHGIGGGRILNDGSGPNALSRFERDVLGQTGVRHLIIFEGVNDLGTLTREAPVSAEAHDALVVNMIGAYRQMIRRAHDRGITVHGATIAPFMGFDYYKPTAVNEADRQAVNRWIRTSGEFDTVIDLDATLRDPARPDWLKPEYDSGDHIHPSMDGYRIIGEAIRLGRFI